MISKKLLIIMLAFVLALSAVSCGKAKSEPSSEELKLPDFTINVEVRLNSGEDATGGWVKSINADPGATVDFLITYKNTGTIQQDDVVIKDTLPDYLTYIDGSARCYNATNPSSTGGISVSDQITGEGLNIGSYAAGADAMVRFSAKVSDAEALFNGATTVTNIGRVETANGSKEDTAVVVINGL